MSTTAGIMFGMYALYVPELKAWLYAPIKFQPDRAWTAAKHRRECIAAVDAAIDKLEHDSASLIKSSETAQMGSLRTERENVKAAKASAKAKAWGETNTTTPIPPAGSRYRDMLSTGKWVRKNGTAQVVCTCLCCGAPAQYNPRYLPNRKQYGCRQCGFTMKTKAPDCRIVDLAATGAD